MAEIATTAEKIDQVIKDMCANPGRSFSKDHHAQKLYDVIQGTTFPRKIADLFIDITLITAPFTGAHSKDSHEALKKLIKEDGNIVNNLLHCIMEIKDTEHSLTTMDFTSGSSTEKKTKVSFKKQRDLAKMEIENRGNPEYNIAFYLK